MEMFMADIDIRHYTSLSNPKYVSGTIRSSNKLSQRNQTKFCGTPKACSDAEGNTKLTKTRTQALTIQKGR